MEEYQTSISILFIFVYEKRSKDESTTGIDLLIPLDLKVIDIRKNQK
jgi:hypothetical protein